jgi:hypothetical protein
MITSTETTKDSTRWDAERYTSRLNAKQDGMNKDVEAKTMKQYPPLFEEHRFLTEPKIITDMHGNVLVWYLPGIFTNSRQVRDRSTHETFVHTIMVLLSPLQDIVWKILTLIDDILPKGIDPSGSSWRTRPEYFQKDDHRFPKPGIINMSPAWFQQGKDVCPLYFNN